jgi:hypothetical protein
MNSSTDYIRSKTWRRGWAARFGRCAILDDQAAYLAAD